jgi:acetyl-CoA C-acetyltransferase
MLLDCYKQCTDSAGDYQIENAKNISTLNIGGSATTVVSFVVGTA